jgi:hypothetical protein
MWRLYQLMMDYDMIMTTTLITDREFAHDYLILHAVSANDAVCRSYRLHCTMSGTNTYVIT